MKLIFTLFLFFIATLVSAQEAYDIINLKDGSFFKGNITEYIPEDHATIQLLDGRIISVKAENILSLNVGEASIIKKNFDIKSKGYYNNTLAGPQFGNSQNNNTQITFAFNLVNGYKLNGHHAGIGLGLENHVGSWYAPIYADYSYHISEGSFSPLVGINGGFLIPLQNEQYGGNYYQYNYEKGGFIGGRIGFAAYTGPHFAFLLNLTYRYIHLSEASYAFPFSDIHSFTGSADLHRVGFMIGFVIN
ncbi:hypothetical protein G3O08_12785 [Cryomorpha ignava]|uniref:Outer membrane beta-barrel protein n=1 Tax=Cryomorpha ignava TaxID=101383 RepID=A0A7K3WRS8_9FLAO|nr:hypothetical protein [Cryomorpha ignava]NEN24380.1 hypothetical protein [Cryomorpha ignava]